MSGTTTVSTNSYSSIGISNAKLYVDGVSYETSAISAYSFSLDTTKYANGSHRIYAVLADSVGGSATSATVTVTVNIVKVTATISITTPTSGYSVAAWMRVTVSAYRISKVELYLDGVLYRTTTASPYTFAWDTTKFPPAAIGCSPSPTTVRVMSSHQVQSAP